MLKIRVDDYGGVKPEEFVVASGVYDPVKVVKTAVQMACSTASMLIMTEGTIAMRHWTLMDELEAGIKQDERFRESIPDRDREKGEEDWWKSGDY